MATRNARIGLVLFAGYLLLYGGFVLLNAFAPQTMEATPIAGINLAVLYGFGLIVAALALALLYGMLCTAEGDVPTNDANGSSQREGTGKSQRERAEKSQREGTGKSQRERAGDA